MQSRQAKKPTNAPEQRMFQEPSSLTMQPKKSEKSQQPDLKTSLIKAECYGHHLNQMQPAGVPDPQTVQSKKTDVSNNFEVIQMVKRKRPGSGTGSSAPKKRRKENSTLIPNSPKKLVQEYFNLTQEQSSYNNKSRPSMPDSVTTRILEQRQVDGMEASAVKMKQLEDNIQQPSELRKGLKQLGMSRNHILADSNIKAGMLIANKNHLDATSAGNSQKANQINQGTHKFINQITNKDLEAATKAKNSWNDSLGQGDNKARYSYLDESQKIVSTTPGNLRIGDSSINSRIQQGFDPVVKGGRYDARTMEVFHSWHKFGREAGIPHNIRFNATMPTIDKTNNTELTSNFSSGEQGLHRVSDDIGLNKFYPRKNLFFNEI